jgi:histidinol-phosphate aminotransferase
VGSINALVKWAGVAALKDTVAEARMKKINMELREKTVAELKGMGYEIIPSETNFFMVNLRRPLAPVSDEFRKRGVLVGRAFPPLVEHMRVSIGTPEEMGRFMTAWKEIMPARAAARSG